MFQRIAVLMAILAVSIAVPAESAGRRDRGQSRRQGRQHQSHRRQQSRDSVSRLMDYNRSYIYGPRQEANRYEGYNRGYRGRDDYGYDDYGYSQPATQRDVRGWSGAAIGVSALGDIFTEVQAGRRNRQAEERHQEQLDAIRSQRSAPREVQYDTPRRAEARGYYGDANQGVTTPNRPERYNVINGIGHTFCLFGAPLGAGESTTSSTDDLEITPPKNGAICKVESRLISNDTILVSCSKGGR